MEKVQLRKIYIVFFLHLKISESFQIQSKPLQLCRTADGFIKCVHAVK